MMKRKKNTLDFDLATQLPLSSASAATGGPRPSTPGPRSGALYTPVA
eukprot:CAMPEP_0115147564 /NCGR_PEP_ID=MMETSP0227-20121206/63385_1 /TAXON_ID=89957 /ORGANISM="Polarella glacialis, Strain CCMP 1383" /LENGTH=46 /DNA_ID= /DNA_START= /DNA_END= /DNA_ORIENTATION=